VRRSSICGRRQAARVWSQKINTMGEIPMLETIAIILVVLWILGLVTSYTLGGFIHILLVIAIIVIVIRVIQGRRL
jgi:hypothetical protein